MSLKTRLLEMKSDRKCPVAVWSTQLNYNWPTSTIYPEDSLAELTTAPSMKIFQFWLVRE